MRKILFLGQGTGGNALLWFQFLNNLEDRELEVHLLSRTIVTLKHNFRVFKPYGTNVRKGIGGKIFNWLVAKVIFKAYVNFITIKYDYDLVILQGNYTPELNLYLLQKCKCKAILNIYGSDFYRKYLLEEFSDQKRSKFQRVVGGVDSIFCNWETTKADFINTFPHVQGKVFSAPWGIDKLWTQPLKRVSNTKSDKIRFLSTRALHSYNNVDLVVEAFCQAFHGDNNKILHIVSAYGESPGVLNRINTTIEKFNMQEQVIIENDRWYEGQDLVDLYDRADFNICFGSSDQLTLSIIYAFARKVPNILSPLKNYRELNITGFSSHVIAEEITVEALKKVFRDYSNISNDIALTKDAELVHEVFNNQRTFNSYLNYEKLLGNISSEF